MEIHLPMSLHLEAMPDDPKDGCAAVRADRACRRSWQGGSGQLKAIRPSAPQLGRVPSIVVPAFVGDLENIAERKARAGRALDFPDSGIGQPQDVQLIPFYKAYDQRYTVYWKVYSPAEWEKRKADMRLRNPVASKSSGSRWTRWISATSKASATTASREKTPPRADSKKRDAGSAQRLVQLSTEGDRGQADDPGLHLRGQRRPRPHV